MLGPVASLLSIQVGLKQHNQIWLNFLMHFSNAAVPLKCDLNAQKPSLGYIRQDLLSKINQTY